MQIMQMTADALRAGGWRFLVLAALLILLLLMLVSYRHLRTEVDRRKRSEAQLALELALKRALLDCLPEPIVAKDAQGRYIEVNPACERTFGFAREDVMGRTADDAPVRPLSAREKLVQLQKKALDTMTPHQSEVELEVASGELRTMLHWAAPFRLPDGSPGGLVNAYIDVSEIHAARNRALQFEQRLKDITDSLPVIVYQARDLQREPGEALWDIEYAAGGGRTAGMRILKDDEPAPESAIVIVDQPALAKSCPHAICLSSELLPLGYRRDSAGVWLAQNPLRWTAFVAVLQASAAPPATPAQEAQAPASVKASILLVEDHAINREVIQQQLRKLGYEASACVNGREAMDLIENQAFDLVVTDCHMPAMDGFELARQIRKSESSHVRELPVIGLTATIVREEHLLCMTAGMNAVLVKPATIAVLGETIAHALQERQGGAANVKAGNAAPVQAATGPQFLGDKLDAARFSTFVAEVLTTPAVRAQFRQALHDDRRALLQLLAAHEVPALAEWCHFAGGAISMLDQPYLTSLIQSFRDRLRAGDPAEARSAGEVLVVMYDHLVAALGEETFGA